MFNTNLYFALATPQTPPAEVSWEYHRCKQINQSYVEAMCQAIWAVVPAGGGEK
jgi:hypothetical protein